MRMELLVAWVPSQQSKIAAAPAPADLANKLGL